MTEGNFVDYVKYLFLPVRRKRIYATKFIEKAVQMEMEV
jgi:hypothetical protein